MPRTESIRKKDPGSQALAYSRPLDFLSLHTPITHVLSNSGWFCLRAFKLSIPSAFKVLSPEFHMASSSSPFRSKPNNLLSARPCLSPSVMPFDFLPYHPLQCSHTVFSMAFVNVEIILLVVLIFFAPHPTLYESQLSPAFEDLLAHGKSFINASRGQLPQVLLGPGFSFPHLLLLLNKAFLTS